jgi:signal transduction histidine kinase
MPINVRITAGDAGVIISIHNHGAPIPREALATLFDPFVRGDDTEKHPGGKGLGLYIARAVVTAHRGTIDVTSTPETGTTFTVHLPRRQPLPVPHARKDRVM